MALQVTDLNLSALSSDELRALNDILMKAAPAMPQPAALTDVQFVPDEDGAE
jgi:hypothetical protein